MTKFIILFLLFPVIAFAQVGGGVYNPPNVIQEEDGLPQAFNPLALKYPNGTVTQNSDGSVSIDTSYISGSGNYIEFVEFGEKIINSADNILDFTGMTGTATDDQITFNFNYATAPQIYAPYKNGIILSEANLYFGINQATDSYLYAIQPNMSRYPAIRFVNASSQWQATTDGQIWFTLTKDTTGAATSMQVQDEDGSPWTSPTVIKFTNGTVTDNGNGSVSVTVGGSGAPKGNNTTVQYNDGGAFDGANTFTYTKGTQTVSARILQVTDSLYVVNTLKAENRRVYIPEFASGSVVYVAGSGQLVTNANLVFNGETLSAPYFAGDGSNITNVGQNLPSALTFSVREENTSALFKGQSVYISGASGNTPLVGKSDNTLTNKSRVVGLIIENTNQNSASRVRRAGVLNNVDTRTTNTNVNPNAETWLAGDLLFASNNGGMTNIRPTSGRSVKVAYSLTGSSVNDTLLVYPLENPVWHTAASDENNIIRAGDSSGQTETEFRDYNNSKVAWVDSSGKSYFPEISAPLIAIQNRNGVLLGTGSYISNVTPGTSGEYLRIIGSNYGFTSVASTVSDPALQIQEMDGSPLLTPQILRITNRLLTDQGSRSVALSASLIQIQEIDNSPITTPSIIKVGNNLITDQGSGIITITPSYAQIQEVDGSPLLTPTIIKFTNTHLTDGGSAGVTIDLETGASYNVVGGLGNIITAPVMAVKNELRIPYGTNPTALSSGQISIDTSPTTGASIRWYGDTVSYTTMAFQSRGFTVMNPIFNEMIPLWILPYAITIKNIYELVSGGTSVVGGLWECDGNGASCVAVDSDITGTAGTTSKDDSNLANSYLDMGDVLSYKNTAITGVVSWAHFTVDFVPFVTN
jgi:hypothetical protein